MSAWIAFVKRIQHERGLTYRQALKVASPLWRQHKGSGLDPVSQALEVVKPVQDFLGSLVAPGTEERFNRWLNGSGMHRYSAHQRGLMAAHDYQQHHMKGGDAGQDIKDFFNGFAYGFSHPDQAFKAIGKLITGHGN